MQRRTIEEELAASGRALSYTVGISMEPLLHNRRSTVVLEKPQGPLRPGDVALYRNARDSYVLHRVIKVVPGGYVIRGDNCFWKETVPAGRIVGVMAGYYADEGGQYTPCGSPADLQYRRTLPLRFARLWLRAFPRRLRRKVGHVLHWRLLRL